MKPQKKIKHKNQDEDLVKFGKLAKDRTYIILKRYKGTNAAFIQMFSKEWVVHKRYAKLKDRNNAFKDIEKKVKLKADCYSYRDYDYLVLNIRNMK